MFFIIWIFLIAGASIILLYHRASLDVFLIGIGVLMLVLTLLIPINLIWLICVWGLGVILSLLFKTPLRCLLISKTIFNLIHLHIPHFSATEEAVITAGNVGWEANLLSGAVDIEQFLDLPWGKLTSEELAFLNGSVHELCSQIDSYQINSRMEIPETIWQKLTAAGFFGLVIPKEYGGKGFSALAQSEIIAKIAAVNTAVATVVSVPNSLGPAELLLHYGTDDQKQYYLPRLANGQEIPCFALTSPVAGSDAGAIVDYGVVCQQNHNGVIELGIRLNWNKRYITLAPVATLIGLAFQLYDPEGLLGKQAYLGITCALVATDLPGVKIGRYHDPLHSAFPNGPTQGVDVFITLNNLIGGVEQVGQGWRMLMERLATGRSISLPSISAGSAKAVTAASTAYARIRRQFNTYIGDFGGVQDHLAKMLSNTFIADSLRLFSVSQIDQGSHSATAAAICKYHTTERTRQVIQAAMDIHGGKGICMGPHNYLAQAHIESAIAITVEGANILTRSLIIFGQGVLRSHPYLLKEINAVREHNVKLFDQYFFKHIGFLLCNQVRAIFMRLTGGARTLMHLSTLLAVATDISLLSQGNALKRNEQLSARLGDLLSDLYMLSAILKHAQAIEQNDAFSLLLSWSKQDLTAHFYQQYQEIAANLSGFARLWLNFIAGSLKKFKNPSDKLTEQLARASMTPAAMGQWLNNGAFEHNLEKIIAVEPLLLKLKQARKNNSLTGKNFAEWLEDAKHQKILTESEVQQLFEAEAIRMSIIQVDDFSKEERLHGTHLV
ncbi:MAG: acyl-CoA dehydrogenase [Proteobacteria bacterium]|nr:acyl-CoA dehydrogenase [Pseudomonadota bacterium]